MTPADWLQGEPIGWFQLPDIPGRAVPTVVRLKDGERPEASVFDSLEEIPQQAGYDWPIEQSHAIVVGRTNLGDVTFVDCDLTYWFTGHDGTAMRWAGNLEARNAYVGATYPTAHALRFTKLRLQLDGIDLWSGLTLAESSWVDSKLTLVTDTGRSLLLAIGDIRVTISLRAVQHPAGNGVARPQRPLMAVEHDVEAESKSPLSLVEWDERLIFPLRFLHGFSLGRLLPLRSLHRMDPVQLPGTDRWVDREIAIVGSGTEYLAAESAQVLSIPMVQLIDNEPQVIMRRWIELWSNERKQTTIRRLLHAATDATSIKSQFTDLAEAAEGWHKASNHDDHTLRSRLEDLAQPAADWKASGYQPLDCAAVVIARNRLAHGDAFPDVVHLHRHTKTLRMLLRYHIAVALGVDSSIAGERALYAERWF